MEPHAGFLRLGGMDAAYDTYRTTIETPAPTPFRRAVRGLLTAVTMGERFPQFGGSISIIRRADDATVYRRSRRVVPVDALKARIDNDLARLDAATFAARWLSD